MQPSYLYHLAFELYPSQENSTAFIPPPGTDIFEADLPVHSTIPWRSSPPKRPKHRRAYTDAFDSAHPPLARPTSPTKNSEAILDPPTADWRLGAVSIESIDMDSKPMASGAGSSRPRGKSMTQHSSADTSSGGGIATRARFIPAEPKATEVGYGVVHLYRDAEETPGLYDDSYARTASGGAAAGDFKEEECSTLCILAVPSYFMPSDLLGWAGERAHTHVSHFRLIRTDKANRYMVLMKFREAKQAREWLKEYNGKAFSNMEPEYAHVVFVSSTTFCGSTEGKEGTSFPSMSDDPFMPKVQPALISSPTAAGEPTMSGALSTRPLAPPPPNLVELPTCPVCLERMDDTTGLLTILCQHVFHCDCLSKWRGSGCPVCRYTQNAPAFGSLRAPNTPAETENACSVCALDQNLWICLICGNVGCGRYDSAHAFAHFEETGHAYAMDIASQHVWDYVGDGYVHRLIQNKSDGKMMDLPDAYGKRGDGGMTAMSADMVPREKMDAMGNEYAYLLQSQLENQRSYFEDQLDRALEKASLATAAAEKAQAALEEVTSMFSQLKHEFEDVRERNKILEKENERIRLKAEKTDTLAKKLAKDWKEEKVVGEGLLERLKVLDARLTSKDEEIAKLKGEKADLEEQNRDLSFFISGGSKLQELKEQGEDIEGVVEVPVASSGEGSGGKGKRRGRKK